MLSATNQHHTITAGILLPLLHRPFDFSNSEAVQAMPPSQSTLLLTPMEALQALQTFLIHADPSPSELSMLLTPIVSELYTLASLYHSSKTGDPNVRESLHGLLNTWGRIVSSSDAIDGLWRIISGSGGNWELRVDGFMRLGKYVEPFSFLIVFSLLIWHTDQYRRRRYLCLLQLKSKRVPVTRLISMLTHSISGQIRRNL